MYKFWCEPSTPRDEELLREQLALAADYRRVLALIENQSRARQRALMRGAKPPSVAERDEAARERLRRARERMREEVEAGDDDASVVAAAESSGMTREEAEYALAWVHVYRDQGRRIRTARGLLSERGLGWGTYQLVDDSHARSCETTDVWRDVSTRASPAEGLVGAHLQPARPLRGAEDRWVQVATELCRRGSEIDRSGRVRPARHREVKIRVGTHEDRTPRWLTVKALVHRELPEGARVAWAIVAARRVAYRTRYELQFVVQGEASCRPAGARADYVGVDIGWRRVDGGIRIAVWSGSDGRSGEVVVPSRALTGSEKSDSLRSIRDRLKNEAREEIARWVDTLRERVALRIGTAEAAEADSGGSSEAADPTEALAQKTPRKSEILLQAVDAAIARSDASLRAVASGASSSSTAPPGLSGRSPASATSGQDVDPSAVPSTEPSGRDATVEQSDPSDPEAVLVEATRSIRSWQRVARFVRLEKTWRGSRVTGDEGALAILQAWLRQDRHLWQWEANGRLKQSRRVKEIVRQLAVSLTRSYETVGIEAPFVSRVVRRNRSGRGPIEESSAAARAAECQACTPTRRCDTCAATEARLRNSRRAASSVAPALIRTEIKVMSAKYRARVVEVDPAFTTRDCARCGFRRDDVEDWSVVVVSCSSCGHAEDQDVTASVNIGRAASAQVAQAAGRPLDASKSPNGRGKPRKRRNRPANTDVDVHGPSKP